MKFCCLMIILSVAVTLQPPARSDDPVFSGPQVGEKLPTFAVKSVLGETAGQQVNVVEQANGKPVLLVFFHARTRPAFGLTNMLMRYAATKEAGELHSAVVFLTDDATPTEQWMKGIQKHFSPKTAIYGISPEGQEGPGSYGLNRNMNLTVLVGHEGKVTGNFALVQPSVQADGPKILKAIVDVTGGGDVPTLASLDAVRYQDGKRGRMKKEMKKKGRPEKGHDPELTKLMRAVIKKDATTEDVKASVDAVEKYVAENKAAQRELGTLTARVVSSDRLASYPKNAQRALKMWAKKYGSSSDDSNQKPADDKDGADTND